MIKLDNVEKAFPGGTKAVRGVSFEVAEGETVTLVGLSGCGKTTTLKMINRLTEPTSGDVLVQGRNTRDWDPILLRRSIGYVIQDVGLMPHLTVAENVAVVPRLLGWPKEKTDRRVSEMLELTGLEPEEFAGRYPGKLSGGQRQRVGVARALAADPDILLMDEPFSALDPITREELQDEFIRLQKRIKKTVVLVTHDVFEAVKMADRMAVMKEGAVEQLGTPRAVLEEPATDFVRLFMGRHRKALLASLEEKNTEGE